jgi:hypothetical protein
MPKASKETTPITMEFPVAVDRSCDLADITVNFTIIREAHDLAPMLATLPTGRCECPHWGVLHKGQITVTYADRVETIEAGEAFYMTPGHTPAAAAGTEFTMFSPAEQLKATNAAIAKGMEAAAR